MVMEAEPSMVSHRDAGVLARLKQELEHFGEQHDQVSRERADKMLNISRETGQLLAVLVQVGKADRVLEVGTSNGYSTLWLAEAVQRLGGAVTTIEREPCKREMARLNFQRAGLGAVITQLAGEAGALLPTLATGDYALIFLDSDRQQYRAWWPELQRLLAPGGLLVVDNALSHREELAEWMAEVAQDPRYVTSLVPVGKGEWLVASLQGGVS